MPNGILPRCQKTVQRNTNDLQQALTRLSTGLRINTGKDDPAGLIASEALRSDMVSIEAAIANSERANQMIATADSALGQVSSLLLDIRGLIVEAANTGAMSEEQIAANQLQVDSSLEAINRIAQTTTFQGRRLLDGTLAFTSTAGAVPSVVDYQIDQATLGASGAVSVDVDILTAATKAAVTNSGGFSAAAQATATLNFAAGFTSTGATNSVRIDIDAASLGAAENGVAVSYVDAVGATTAAYDSNAKTLVITADFTNAVITGQNVVDAVNANSEFVATGANLGLRVAAADVLGNAMDGTTAYDAITLTAVDSGADFNGTAISVVGGAANGATYDALQNTIVVTVNNAAAQTVANVVTAINTGLSGVFTAASSSTGTGRVNANTVDVNATANTDNTGGNVLTGDVTFSVGGVLGREVFKFEAGASVNQLVAAINLVADATGVAASQSSGTMTLSSTTYGSKALVDVNVITEGTGGTFENGLSSSLSNGTDVVAQVNGVNANGDGNTLSINTSTLDLSITVTDGSDANFVFEITGGGALFQLGPDVASNQQVRMGIQSLNTASLRSPTGLLQELASGAARSLANDPNGAHLIVDDVIGKVASLRGRLGAFQRATVDTNIASLTDTLTNLTEAESTIRDADFAKESSALTRAQILVQSGMSVLAIANSNPQNVLALLR
ncbi:MAG: flagellin [Planctomycetes bacterium]|nr:flagellin [Planctomycetota bacterium]